MKFFEVAKQKLDKLKALFKNSGNIELIFNKEEFKEFESIFKDIKEELGRKKEIKYKIIHRPIGC